MKIGIVAHEKRIVMAYKLFEDARADFIRVDNGSLGCEGTHRRVWKETATMADDDEWIIVLEDDSVIAPDFRQQAQWALASVPEDVDVVSFYLGRLRPPQWQHIVKDAVAQADSEEACWILSDTTLHAVALAIRNKQLVDSMLDKTANYDRPIDERITMWCRQFGHRSAYAHPSIVDHADGESVITKRHDGQKRTQGRVAWSYGRREHWTQRSVKLR